MNNQDWSVSHQWALRHNCWVAYLKCSVVYDGTAVGHLPSGDYVVMCKADGSISVSGGDLNKFKNYIRSTERYGKENIITFKNKKEKLHLDIDKLYWFQPINSWTCNKVSLYRTEQQLVQKFCDNIEILLPEAYGGEVVLEYRIPGNGAVDVGIFKPNETWIVEVKRKKATQQTTGQILKYRDHYSESHQPNLVLVAPDISDNGLQYAESNGISFIPLDWDPLPSSFKMILESVA